MTKNTNDKSNSINNMAAIQTAIANGEVDRLKELLAGLTLDQLQKSYLIDFAKMNSNSQVQEVIENAPVKP